jgi:phosphatidylserine/phosphatidylglycerophosphate/cardiolipin synthase-like enzyme
VSIDICVFTITDNRIADAIRTAHRDGVRLRIMSDNEKSLDLGSDVAQLAAGGVPVRIDTSPYHMHHKFAIFDAKTLLTGSYNWTLGAARDNEENLIVTGDAHLLQEFQRVFDGLWNKFADFGSRP